MSTEVKCIKKLIEVAIPLDAINEECDKQSSNPFLKGHPRSLHIWWARRPLAAARAVIFCQLVNDPSGRWELENPGKVPPNNLKASWAAKRKQLFNLIKELILWKNTTNEDVLERARNEIKKSWFEVCEVNRDHPNATELFNPDKLPAFHDPFAGGGAIPLEAQRLGLEAYASDLNPVAVLINKAMIEIPPVFACQTPIGPLPAEEATLDIQHKWLGASGIAEDVKRYGLWMRAEAKKRIGHLYPQIEITKALVKERPDLEPKIGEKLSVIAWLWARTVKSPNPAYRHVDVPLVSTFVLSSKEEKEAFVEPIIRKDTFEFIVKTGQSKDSGTTERGTKLGGSHSSFFCLFSDVPISFATLRHKAQTGEMGYRLMAIIAEGRRGREYFSPSVEHESIARSANPNWKPDITICHWPGRTNVVEYGMTTFGDLFTPRQLVALNTFSDLLPETIDMIMKDAIKAGMKDDGFALNAGGKGALAYAQAVGIYLALVISRWTDLVNSICTWNNANENIRALFSRQAIPMSWDFVELSAFSPIGGFDSLLKSFIELAPSLPTLIKGHAEQADAQNQELSRNKIVSTDPPYYDNIGYASLSDYFYVWLRRMLKPLLPNLFSTIAVPKKEELVVTPYQHSTKEDAEAFFLNGMTSAMSSLVVQAHPGIPVTIYYARKQSEKKDETETITGWEVFLEAVLGAGFSITGTWPLRTEREARSLSIGNNALASSIVLVCRRRPDDAPTISRREFLRELNTILPDALEEMIHGTEDGKSPIAPVDLSQAIIGPGMSVFSKYSGVLEADGSKMSVRTALQLINRYFAANDFDPDTQWCLKWFEQNGWKEGVFGQADDLSRALGTSVAGVAESGVIKSGGGKVRLLRPNEYPTDWNPKKDKRIPIWETLHHLIRSLRSDGETATGKLLGNVKNQIEGVRLLAFRLYTLCERSGWAEDARSYNELMTSWSAVESAAGQVRTADQQGELF